MNIKNLFKYGLMAICIFGNATAMDGLLIVGCRPWDDNIQGVKGLKKAQFVDRMIHRAPEQVPASFHHYDLNEVGSYSVANPYYNGPLAGKFSDFAKAHPGAFKMIIIDWITYHHIGENKIDTAWQSFSTLLCQGGTLIVPVTAMNLQTYKIVSTKKAIDLSTKLTPLFDRVELLKYDALPVDECFDLLRRPSITTALSMDPVIIFATKQGTIPQSIIPVSTPVTVRQELPSVIERKEVKFPNLQAMTEILKRNESLITIESETSLFDVQTLGLAGCSWFSGFRPEVDLSKIALRMKSIHVSPSRDFPSMKPDGFYTLCGLFKIYVEGPEDAGISLLLKIQDKKAPGYDIEGEGAVKTDSRNSMVYSVSNPNQIRIFIK